MFTFYIFLFTTEQLVGHFVQHILRKIANLSHPVPWLVFGLKSPRSREGNLITELPHIMLPCYFYFSTRYPSLPRILKNFKKIRNFDYQHLALDVNVMLIYFTFRLCKIYTLRNIFNKIRKMIIFFFCYLVPQVIIKRTDIFHANTESKY